MQCTNFTIFAWGDLCKLDIRFNESSKLLVRFNTGIIFTTGILITPQHSKTNQTISYSIPVQLCDTE